MKYVVILALLLSVNVLCAQPDSPDNVFIAGRVHYGFILAPEEITYLPFTRPYGFELNIGNLFTSYNSWKTFRAYNIAGLQAAYYNYRNPDIIGSSYMLTAYTEPIVRKGRSTLFSMSGGLGLSYQTRIFHPVTDSLNKFVSARVSFIFYISARLKYALSSNTLLTFSANFNHISNGAIRIPNLGLNFPTFSLGLEFFPKQYPRLDDGYTYVREEGTSGQYLVIQGLGGFRYIYDEPAGIYAVSTRYMRQFNSWFGLNAGAELMMDGGIKKAIAAEKGNEDYKRFAVTAGYDLILGKFAINQYLGVYLYSPRKPKDPVYQKSELSYRIFPDIRAGIAIKTYIGEVDFVGMTLSYLLRLN